MITFKIDVSGAVQNIQKKIDAIKMAQIDREAANHLRAMMPARIHKEGLASDGQPIGTYSPAYMKVRTGNYGNSVRFKRGANAGQAKDAGVYSRGKKKGQPRPKYNLSNDPKIIVALTRGLFNSWTTMETEKGWGVGFNKPDSFQKLKWVEAQKKKIIGSPTKEEYQSTMELVRQIVHNILDEQ